MRATQLVPAADRVVYLLARYCTEITVRFTSTAHDSDDTTFTYRWTFPNGSVSTLANPTYAFGTAGTKTVTLIVFDPHGDQVRVARTITVT